MLTIKTWKDSRLAWEPIEYGGLTRTTITSESIWWPKIQLVNQDERMNYGIEYFSNARLSNGKV